MPRFEMYLFMVETDQGNVESSESEIVCWVKNSNDMQEVQSVANEIINDRIEEADNTVMFGSASIMVHGEEVLNLGFRNNELDPNQINKVIDLFSIEEEETIH